MGTTGRQNAETEFQKRSFTMALNDVSLTAGMRSNLISLQNTTTLLDRTQSRLSTGKKVITALDNPTNFFAAQSHTQRSADLTNRKDAMGEAIQGVRAANDGITGITALIEAARGLTQSARSADRSGRDNLTAQFNTMLSQITQLAGDSGYKGKNFLKADSLQVLFNENGGSFLTIQGFSATATGLTVNAVTVGTSDTVKAGLSTTQSSGLVQAAVGIHKATLASVTSPSNVATGYFYGNTGSLVGGALSGTAVTYTIDVTGTARFNATGVSYSGSALGTGFAITTVYFNGHTGVGAQVVTGTGGVASIAFSGGDVAAADASWNSGTAVSVSFDIYVAGHAAGTSNLPSANITVFNLSGTDVASGAMVNTITTGAATGVAGGNFQSGVAVYIDNKFVADPATQFWFSGTNLIFTGAAAPGSGSVTYNYNTGFTVTSGVNQTQTSVFTGITLGAGQTITAVKVAGVDVTNSVTISSNQMTFATGSEPAHGSAVTYTVTTAGATGGWASDAGIDTSVNQLDAALGTLRTQTAALASNLSVVDIRQTFTSQLVNDLLKGADNLTLADTNEEGANMLMLQTRQQLSTTSLKMASDAAQAVLRLF